MFFSVMCFQNCKRIFAEITYHCTNGENEPLKPTDYVGAISPCCHSLLSTVIVNVSSSLIINQSINQFSFSIILLDRKHYPRRKQWLQSATGKIDTNAVLYQSCEGVVHSVRPVYPYIYISNKLIS